MRCCQSRVAQAPYSPLSWSLFSIHRCAEFLRKGQVGRATFLILEKQAHLKDRVWVNVPIFVRVCALVRRFARAAPLSVSTRGVIFPAALLHICLCACG